MGRGKVKAGAKPKRRKEKVGIVERLTTLTMLAFLLSLAAQQVLAATPG